MKKLFVCMMLLTGTLAAQAYDYPYLTFQTSDGTTKTVSVESLVITFNNGQMVATSGTDSQTISLSQLSKMFFSISSDATAISEVTTESDAIEVFSISGHSLGRYTSSSEAKNALKSGVYIFKSKNNSAKIAIK